MDDLQQHISTLEEDVKQKIEKLRQTQNPRFLTPQHSTPKEQPRNLTDSGRRQRASETLPELGQTIRRLVNRAYPLAPTEVKETLSKDYFLDALHDSEMRIKIKQSRPQNLNQAICLAVELEAFYKAEKRQDFVKPQMRATHADNITEELSKDDKFTEMMDSFTKQLESLRMELNEFKNSGQRNTADPEWKRNQQCYNCGKYGHFKRECDLQQGTAADWSIQEYGARAGNNAIGAVLSQEIDGKGVVSFGSRTLSKTELKYYCH
ncbi:unnamed protein product [Mytilus edulis]|uniref:CCHC-type domain-containing protein n=1 Tax=Mytilus edulis TaxID=6550 RepID=A0A8S3RPC7_MYTED|nr:unnamed protein product [Mytilus edulis]